MKAIIFPSRLSGTTVAPPSKSYTHRAIILAALAFGKSRLENTLISDDTKATIEACKLLGAKITVKRNLVEVEGAGGRFPKKSKPITINCGLSGTTIRLIAAIAALSPNEIILTGEKRLTERPIGELVKILKLQGVDIRTAKNNQFPPVKINGGNVTGGEITVSGKISSQFISALLIIAPFALKDTQINISDLKSAPYVDITVDMMRTFGVSALKNGNRYKIQSGQKYKAQKYKVEGDYSSASYLFAAASVTNSHLKIDNLNPGSVQGDKYFLEILEKMKKNNLPEIKFNLGNYPDIVPSVSVVAASQRGTTIIENIAHLRTKESDRVRALATELSKMNIHVLEKKDALVISGGGLKGAQINTYNDHRIAMSFAVAGLAASGKTVINNAEVVNKSYPDFWKDLQKLGAKIKIIN